MSATFSSRPKMRAHAFGDEDRSRDARRVLATAMISIGRSSAPLETFKQQETAIDQAMQDLGRDFSAQTFLESCGIAGESFPQVDESEELADHSGALPKDAAQAFESLICDEFAMPGEFAITQVIGGPNEGFEFEYTLTADGECTSYEGFALAINGKWFLAPGPIEREDVDATSLAARKYFDIVLAMPLHLKGVADTTILEYRRSISPQRVLWPHETSPEELAVGFPFVFLMNNPLPNGRSLLCGLEPIEGDCKAILVD